MKQKRARARHSNYMRKHRYVVQLSFPMLAAVVDISSDYEQDDSPRWDHRTTAALLRRGIIREAAVRVADEQPSHALTTKGKAYLEMAAWERAHREARRRAS